MRVDQDVVLNMADQLVHAQVLISRACDGSDPCASVLHEVLPPWQSLVVVVHKAFRWRVIRKPRNLDARRIHEVAQISM